MKTIKLSIVFMILTLIVCNSYKSRKKFTQQGGGLGMSLLTHFLTSDSTSKLKDSGGIFDDSGVDGLENENVLQEGTEARFRQKARSAASLYMKNQGKDDYQSYGCSPDQTERELDKQGWKSYVVLMMNKVGEHILLKCCVSMQDSQNGNISFVITTDNMCAEKIPYAEEYYKSKDQFDSNLNSHLSKDQQIEKLQQEILEKRKKKKQEEEKAKVDQQQDQQPQQNQTSNTQDQQQQVTEQPTQQSTAQQPPTDNDLDSDADQIKKQMEQLNSKLKSIEEKKKTKKLNKEDQPKPSDQSKPQDKDQTKQLKVQEQSRFNQVTNQDESNISKTAKLESEVNSMKSDIQQIKDMLMHQMQSTSQQKDKNTVEQNEKNVEDQKDAKKQEIKKVNISAKKKIKRMRFLETEEEMDKKKDTDSLAQDIADIVERQVRDDDVANEINKPHTK